LASESAFIDEFERTLSNHLEQFVAATTAEAWLLRQALEARLRIFFRRAVLDAAAVFAFLGLSAIDLERLRGELARRAAFPERRPAS
jgi:predicted ATPase